MPIVFCASLPPWPRLYRPAETSCMRRNRLSTLSGDARRKTFETATMRSAPSRKPSSGETRMKTTVFQMPAPIREPVPAFAITAPTMPPISACDELDGMPRHQVIRFQAIAPISAPKTTWWSTTPGCDDPLADRRSDAQMKDEDRDDVEERREDDRLLRLQHAGRDDGGDRVRRIVKAVHEVERERERDQQRDDAERDFGRRHGRPRPPGTSLDSPHGRAGSGPALDLTSSPGPRLRSGWRRPRSGPRSTPGARRSRAA